MTSAYLELPGSHRDPPKDASAIASAHAVSPADQIEVSIYLKDHDSDPIDQTPISAAEYAATAKSAKSANDVQTQRLAEYQPDIDAISKFASEAGLSVVKVDASRRLVKVSGTVTNLEAAFRTKLHYYNNGVTSFRARAGSLSVPADVADKIEAVLGLDTRPLAKPKLTIDPHIIVGHLPSEIAKLYDFPSTAGKGTGQCIALIELGGGFLASDNKKAFGAMGLPTPSVVSVSVSGGLNKPGVDPGADGEVALDIQVAGGAAPGAKVAVYFAPNTVQGFVDAITRACHDPVNRPSIISISWGSPEANWTGQGLAAMTTAFKDAARLNITVLAAAGDNLATDGLSDNRAHTDFPASSPYVLGCGGTVIDTNKNGISDERVWNNGGSGTGGGISDSFGLPAYQSKAKVPASVNQGRIGRGVPDVAANADPSSGYRTVVGGRGSPIGGTSAVAPLWAGLFALINEDCGKPAGFVHPLFYGNPSVFRQITSGNNNSGSIGYSAGSGWNACTGLGVPQGGRILKIFRTALGKSVASATAQNHVSKPAKS
jgi:kumamolisin